MRPIFSPGFNLEKIYQVHMHAHREVKMSIEVLQNSKAFYTNTNATKRTRSRLESSVSISL